MLDTIGANNFVRQMFERYVEPELDRRGLASDTPVGAFQILMFTDGRPAEIRLDDEIRIAADVELRPGAEVQPNGKILLRDIETIRSSRLPPDDDPNAGYATVIFYGDFKKFHASFDLRYNRAHASRHLDLAKEYSEAARVSQKAGFLRPACDNLFSAMELASLAWLALHHGSLLTAKTHAPVHSELNRQAHLRNVEADPAPTLNRLRDLREAARYLRSGDEARRDEVEELIAEVREFTVWVAAQIASQ